MGFIKSEQLFKEKDFLTYEDISKIYPVGDNLARAIVRSIKQASGLIKTTGFVTKGEYELWEKGGKPFLVFNGGVEQIIQLLDNFIKIKGKELTVERLIRILKEEPKQQAK